MLPLLVAFKDFIQLKFFLVIYELIFILIVAFASISSDALEIFRPSPKLEIKVKRADKQFPNLQFALKAILTSGGQEIQLGYWTKTCQRCWSRHEIDGF